MVGSSASMMAGLLDGGGIAAMGFVGGRAIGSVSTFGIGAGSVFGGNGVVLGAVGVE